MATVDKLADPWFKPPPRGEDLPYDDGEPMESNRHRQQMNLLIETLADHFRDRDDVFVSGNMFIYFSELQAKKNDFRGPDVFVVMDTHRGDRRSWVVWEEDGRTPDVVIELTSPSTEAVDRGDKKRIYAQMLRVPEYYIYDPWTQRLDAFELDLSTRSYRERTPDGDGRFPSRVTGLSLGVVPGCVEGVDAPWLRWITPEGVVVTTGRERADQEAARADQEATRADQEAARAAQEAARAAQEAARAEHEAARAEEALRRVAELEAKLAKR